MEKGNYILVELTSEDALTDGKPFDGLAAGTFLDMWFHKAEFKSEDFPEYAGNTQAAIEMTRTESGELVGLPIDAQGHENGDGAGWIVGASHEGDKIRLTPKWTEIGLELLEKGIRRFFSATVDIEKKVILGGTLTNWPATRNEKGQILLRPIELESSHSMFQFEKRDDGFDFSAWLDDQRKSLTGMFETLLPISRKLDASANELASHLENQPAQDDAGKDEIPEQSNDTEVIQMELTKEELAEMISEQVKDVLKGSIQDLAQAPPEGQDGDNPENGDKPAFDVLAWLEQGDARNDVNNAIKETYLEAYEQMQERAKTEAVELISRIRREKDIGELRHLATTGTDESPRAFPVEPEKMEEFMLSLDADQLAYFKVFLTTVLDKGMIEFSELGHSRDEEGTLELPEDVAEKLDNGEFTLADLNNPILALGDLSRYNLSQWKKEKE